MTELFAKLSLGRSLSRSLALQPSLFALQRSHDSLRLKECAGASRSCSIGIECRSSQGTNKESWRSREGGCKAVPLLALDPKLYFQ